MKSKVLLLVITIVAVAATAVFMSGCSCSSSKKDAKNGENGTTGEAVSYGQGGAYVQDNFPTISPTEKTTDKNGNTVISYTNADGNKVTRTYEKGGKIHVVIKDKKGKVIKDTTFKDGKKEKTTTKKSSGKSDKKKDDKDKKDDGEHAGVVNNDDGWSDFY